MIPAEMTGGWERVDITIGDAGPVEDSVVWWLQGPTRHADLRVPVSATAGPLSFAGTTTWDGASLTWTPALELEASTSLDIGAVTWDGPDLMEAGTFEAEGGEVGYVERWRRLPGTLTPQVALERPGARIVRTGELALTLVDDRPDGSFTAVAWRLADGTWTESHRWPVGSAEVLAAPPVEVPVGDAVDLADGHRWQVTETGGS